MSDNSGNNKIVEYGGPFVGCAGLYGCMIFYPALVIAMQFGMSFFHSEDEALFPSLFVGLFVLAYLYFGLNSRIPIFRYSVFFLYIICLVPALQYWFWDGDYIPQKEYYARIEEMGKEWELSGDEKYEYLVQAPFPGFDWWWFIPKASDMPKVSECPVLLGKAIVDLLKIIIPVGIFCLIVRYFYKYFWNK